MKKVKLYIITIFLFSQYFANETAKSQTITFPEHSSIINITQSPYNADNTGNTDVSDIIQQAIDDNTPGGWKIIYFPKGEYLVSKTIRWSSNSWSQGPVFQGYHTDSTIIRLKDTAQYFGEPFIPMPVLWTGEKVAQKFNRGIRNMTINTGKGNPGAVGIQFFSNNEGIMSDVKIISGDGTGVYGLDMGFGGENGPLLVRNVYIKGFETAINIKALNSVTLTKIKIEGQTKTGIINDAHVCSIEELHSINSVTAVSNLIGGSTLTMINSVLEGGSSENIAIENKGNLFLRNISTMGYKSALLNSGGEGISPEGNDIAEFSSHGVTSLFPNSGTSMNLKIKHPPVIPWEHDMDQWVNIQDYGAVPNDAQDDSRAIQDAIDAGKTTVYIPNNGLYQLLDTVYIRGKVNRITGINAWLQGKGKFVLTDGETDAVIVEKIRKQNPLQTYSIENASDRTLVMEACIFGKIIAKGSGDIFLSDVLGKIILNGPDQHIWARHFNTENPGEDSFNIHNKGGNLWILGLKTESYGIKNWVSDGGRTEILGAHIYPQCTEKLTPMMKVEDAYYSGAGIRESNFCNKEYPSYYTHYVIEKQGDVIDTLFHDDAPAKGQGHGNAYTLYLSADEGLQKPSKPMNLQIQTSLPDVVTLNWDQQQENVDEIIVFRKDSGLFEPIDTIPGNSFQFVDHVEEGKFYYYKLKAFSNTGLVSWSPAVRAIIGNTSSGDLQKLDKDTNIKVFPNPSPGIFTLDLGSFAGPGVEVNVYNQSGRLVYHRKSGNETSLNIDFSNESGGLYYISINSKSEIIRKKIIKL